MPYSTPAMVRLALGPSLNGSLPGTTTNTAADLSDSQLADAIAEADSTINGYLANIYITPVAAVGDSDLVIPHPVDYWSRDIAAYLATCTYRGQMNIESTNPVLLRYNAVLGFLKDVASGKARLPLPRNGDTVGAGAASAPVNPYIGDLWDPSDFSLTPSWSSDLAPGPYWSPWNGYC